MWCRGALVLLPEPQQRSSAVYLHSLSKTSRITCSDSIPNNSLMVSTHTGVHWTHAVITQCVSTSRCPCVSQCVIVFRTASLPHCGSIQPLWATCSVRSLAVPVSHTVSVSRTACYDRFPSVTLFLDEYMTAQLTANVSPAGESSGSNSQVPDVKRFSAVEIERCTAHAYSTCAQNIYRRTCISVNIELCIQVG